MNFRTQVQIIKSDISISHETKMMLFGSCFSENIGVYLKYHKFNVDINPFGILYNPMSISKCIRRLIDQKSFKESDLVLYNEVYHSFMHHGSFSDSDKDISLKNINYRFNKAKDNIANADILLITFGTAYAFSLEENDEIVSNCHRFPADKFMRFRLSTEEIVEDWTDMIEMLTALNSELKIIFTVSPIRHLRDGAHDNQISKSILHLAIDNLQQYFRNIVDYFPAFEIMNDELRDYRFYNDDMTHPTSLAKDYIWRRFSDKYFSEQAVNINNEWSELAKSINHRPIHAKTQANRKFLSQTLENLRLFSKKHPHISCTEEIFHLNNIINNTENNI